MIILSVDSSSSTATCALVKEDKILGEINLNDKKEHSVILMDLIDSLLTRYNLTLDDIDGFAISEGPGSFTGLRIGMATIKGLAFGSNKPCLAISTLDTLAYNVINFNGIICPIMDALRGNVYTNLYKNNNGKLEAISEANCLSIEELVSVLKEKNEPVIFLGDGVVKHKDYLLENLSNLSFAPLNSNYPKASSLGELALQLFNSNVTQDLNKIAPVYLRKSQAEREYEARTGI
ncbi:tRNA (adenosine(37)-N6)-threonylcarbamoyltransferase complex dimerization subunit type 1 TsaB [Clostridium massiliamazoniense]|uniref:tRNA (adenosine(37)-N6)-threonylcarbamoyltransferase complex dimerization subunit type 1 TsaB n=1 Tax=Clostridium massiliamazoniense TaxID=1347366 RepID=UPI0006D8428B|nr:tRNA (adenosine(37)-N6)-threonylcarbamoyltransferase complex dimerization subunit type 1 TsaB [Clostridium massiliamazoniense]